MGLKEYSSESKENLKMVQTSLAGQLLIINLKKKRKSFIIIKYD